MVRDNDKLSLSLSEVVVIDSNGFDMRLYFIEWKYQFTYNMCLYYYY